MVVAKGPWQKFASSGRERLLAARVLEKIRERFRVALRPTEFRNVGEGLWWPKRLGKISRALSGGP